MSARERFRVRQRNPLFGTPLQLVAGLSILVAAAVYYFGVRHFPADAFGDTLRAGDERGSISVRVETDPTVMSMPFTTAAGDTVRLHMVGPAPARFYWGADDFAARTELDYESPLATEIERALMEARDGRAWSPEAETFLQSLRARRP